jgi:hypothetical protein
MKKLIAILAMSVLAASAFADAPRPRDLPGSTGSSSSANQTSTTNSAATNQGNNAAQSITFTSPPVTTNNVNYSGEQTIKNVPSVNGPALTTSNDTCMGSTSGSVNIAGLGIGGGSTWTDANCVLLKNSRELWNMGMKAAAMALMCKDADNKEALELTGFKCPQTKRDEEAQKAAAAAGLTNGPNMNDPIIRARVLEAQAKAKAAK